MCSKGQNLKCCSGGNVIESASIDNQSYPHVVNKQLPPKVLEPIVQNKIIEVPKEVYLEKIIEVPQIKTVEKIVEQIRPIIKYKNVYKPKTVYVEKIKNIDKVIYKDKIIEVPQIKTVEKVVEVPVYINRERIVKVPKYMIVERVIPILKATKTERTVELPEVNCPKIDVEEVESKERIDIKDIKENQTTEGVDEKEEEIYHELNKSNVNVDSTLNLEIIPDQTMNTITQENLCSSYGCKFLPICQNFVKVTAPVFRSYQNKDKFRANAQVFQAKQAGFPKIRIAKTPHINQRSFYCNCS